MTFTKEESEVLKSILNKHLEEVEKNEKISGMMAGELGAEVNYAQVLKSILKKIE